MAERAIFLDRDNTIIANDGYLGEPSQVKLMQGAATAIAALRRLGYRIVVVSNQSGVARGMFDEAAVETVNQEMCRQLREQAGAHIDASYYCPFHPDGTVPQYKQEHAWRKPQPGMLLQAGGDFGLDLRQSWMIGDQPRDIAAGAAAGCRTILLRNSDPPPADADPPDSGVVPNFVVKTLADAARVIAREGLNTARETPVPPPATEPATASLPAPAPAAAPAETAPPADALAANPAAKELEALRPVLEDLTNQLRQRNREQQMPEFSLGRMVAAIVQAFVPFFLFMAAWDAISAAQAGQNDAYYWYNRTTGQLTAMMWLLAALVFQAFVLALYQNTRR